jgi:hypothetical protein
MENRKFLSGLLLLALMLPLHPEPLINDTSAVATTISSKYNLPAFLQGRVDVDTYRNWLLVKARSLHSRDLRKKRPYAKPGTWTHYRQAIHEAVVRAGEFDPFTGAALNTPLPYLRGTLRLFYNSLNRD